MSVPLSGRPHENLQRLAAVLEAGIPLPADLSDWLLDAVHDHMRTAEPLDRALGLARPGARKAPSQLALDLRNLWILEAALLLGLSDKLGNVWPVATDLRERLVRASRQRCSRARLQLVDPAEDHLQHPDQFYIRCGFARPVKPEEAAAFVDLHVIPRIFHFGLRVDSMHPVPTSPRQIKRILDGAR